MADESGANHRHEWPVPERSGGKILIERLGEWLASFGGRIAAEPMRVAWHAQDGDRLVSVSAQIVDGRLVVEARREPRPREPEASAAATLFGAVAFFGLAIAMCWWFENARLGTNNHHPISLALVVVLALVVMTFLIAGLRARRVPTTSSRPAPDLFARFWDDLHAWIERNVAAMRTVMGPLLARRAGAGEMQVGPGLMDRMLEPARDAVDMRADLRPRPWHRDVTHRERGPTPARGTRPVQPPVWRRSAARSHALSMAALGRHSAGSRFHHVLIMEEGARCRRRG